MIRRAKHRWSLLWAARFVAKWEGFLARAYLDTIADPSVWTIGYGHTGDVHPGETITKREARQLLANDLRTAARAVERNIHVRLSVRQRIALISLAFNCGEGAVNGSTLQRELNRKNYRKAANCFLDWVHAGGEVVQGLVNRRKQERWMFLHTKRKGAK